MSRNHARSFVGAKFSNMHRNMVPWGELDKNLNKYYKVEWLNSPIYVVKDIIYLVGKNSKLKFDVVMGVDTSYHSHFLIHIVGSHLNILFIVDDLHKIRVQPPLPHTQCMNDWHKWSNHIYWKCWTWHACAKLSSFFWIYL